MLAVLLACALKVIFSAKAVPHLEAETDEPPHRDVADPTALCTFQNLSHPPTEQTSRAA
jgi:hypothetical protein